MPPSLPPLPIDRFLPPILAAVREDLILVVMSATLEAEPVARFLGDCPIVRAEGRTFPVRISHLPAVAKTPLPDRAADAVARAIAGEWPKETAVVGENDRKTAS